MSQHPPKAHQNTKTGIELLPNLFITAYLFSGFYSIISAINGQLEFAVIAIIIAIVANGLTQKVLLVTQEHNQFEKDFSNLANLCAFGIAPSVLVYCWGLGNLEKFGWLVTFFLVASTAIRLAKVKNDDLSRQRQYIQGLASPASAAIVASVIWFFLEFELTGFEYEVTIAILMAICSLMMFSNIRYNSLVPLVSIENVAISKMLLIILALLLVAWRPAEVLMILSISYLLSGPSVMLSASKEIKIEQIIGDSHDADFPDNNDPKK